MKRILVALDSSNRAERVLGAALRLATMADAKLVVYRAIGLPPDMPHEMFRMTDVNMEDYLLDHAYRDLQRLVRDVPPERIEKVTTSLAKAWDGICTAAKENDVDLIVIGSHGYGGLDRVLGTTAGKVVNHADRNVLVVRTVL
jgi:nucleotide-binding universal stress UspA family protein